MSCRVLGRKVEEAVLQELVEQARARGISRLVGRYLPTEKNKLVEAHYEKLGFTLLERAADGSSRWQLDVADVPATGPLPMQIERLGFGAAVAA
jgi:predicted enzyme involved in methoxymalonyl-ACP biosynthesis